MLLTCAAFNVISFSLHCFAGIHKDLPRGRIATPKVNAAGMYQHSAGGHSCTVIALISS